jgi:hypothetical protein
MRERRQGFAMSRRSSSGRPVLGSVLWGEVGGGLAWLDSERPDVVGCLLPEESGRAVTVVCGAHTAAARGERMETRRGGRGRWDGTRGAGSTA